MLARVVVVLVVWYGVVFCVMMLAVIVAVLYGVFVLVVMVPVCYGNGGDGRGSGGGVVW